MARVCVYVREIEKATERERETERAIERAKGIERSRAYSIHTPTVLFLNDHRFYLNDNTIYNIILKLDIGFLLNFKYFYALISIAIYKYIQQVICPHIHTQHYY